MAGAAPDDRRAAALASARCKAGGPEDLAAFDFPRISRAYRAGTKRRASLQYSRERRHCVPSIPAESSLHQRSRSFRAALTAENHTLKRALTDPRMFSGIGNAYSDEILHAAQLSLIALTHKLKPERVGTAVRTRRAPRSAWIDGCAARRGPFPEKVTAFARHGGPWSLWRALPAVRGKMQRIRYADKETNYCARCQTGGKLLADRSLSRLLESDWPRTLEEWRR